MLREKSAFADTLRLTAGLALLALAVSASAQTAAPAGRGQTAPAAATAATAAPEQERAAAAQTTAPASQVLAARPRETPAAGVIETPAAEASPAAEATTINVASPAAADPPAAAAADPPATAKAASPAGATALQPAACQRTVTANVVAVSQPYMLNRLGAAMPQAMVYALTRDVVQTSSGVFQLRPGKRPRPIVLRANVGDCLKINFVNRLQQVTPPSPPAPPPPAPPPAPPAPVPTTTEASIHVQGMQLVDNIMSDGSFVGRNPSSLAAPVPASPAPALGPRTYTLYAEREGTFLLYSTGDLSTTGQQLLQGLFGAVNVQPQGAEWYRSQVTADELARATYKADSLPGGARLSCPSGGSQCTLTVEKRNPPSQVVTTTTTTVLRGAGGALTTAGGQPVINYDAVNADGRPILKMLDNNNELAHSDLTAIITGSNGGRFVKTTPGPDQPCEAVTNPADAIFCLNPALPDRRQPYREFTIIYHEVNSAAVQAFPIFYDPKMRETMLPGIDGFAINYGTGGIGAEIFANRIGVGPMANCVDCKYEEFFLSSWAVGDPAMAVDTPANSQLPGNVNANSPCTTSQLQTSTPCDPTPGTRNPATGFPYSVTPLAKATKALYPEDPSNVYHSYLNDHVKFRIHHGGTGVTHAHHQHAHQWLQSPNSDQSNYLDTQLISPGASYTLEIVFGGSGNHNKTSGDSIFHCHFYPHFAAGMWSMWRVHDVFESGTQLNADGTVAAGARALPDGEISGGTPIPALVPLPTIAMALMPSPVFIQNGQIVYGTPASPDPTGSSVTKNPGYPFFIPGKAGLRAPHPPMDFAPQLDAAGNPIPGQFLDGGLPRHLITGGTVGNERHTGNKEPAGTPKNDWSKDLATLDAVELPNDGTAVEKVAIAANSQRNNASFTPDGSPAMFVMNGLPCGPQLGAPFADPAVDTQGNPVLPCPPAPAARPSPRRYKIAAFQDDVVLNKQGWHFPQQRMLGLWQDVNDTIQGRRPPEPLFFRANSGEVIEIWHTNLVPNYYAVDDFQVRTPTDIIGQHVHLVKFDVMASDGAANGWNYEDGTFAPPEVQEIIHAINERGGLLKTDGTKVPLTATKPPADILACPASSTDPRCKKCPDPVPGVSGPVCQSWVGAQTTVQRWYSDPLKNDQGTDRSLRTVFTHDHFGPSTHQQAGLYAGALIEPRGSQWRNSETGQIMGGESVRPDGTTQMLPPVAGRRDGGPTSWKADILLPDSIQIGTHVTDSYREFALEFQDFQLAYTKANKPIRPFSVPSAPNTPIPLLVSTGRAPGTYSVNYKNEPVPYRVGKSESEAGATPIGVGDLSFAFSSSYVNPGTNRKNGDPWTPQLRVFENDKVQVRTLVGAHSLFHSFNIQGVKWLSEISWPNSGYRSSQVMGLSEHFELFFTVPTTSISRPPVRACPDGTSPGGCADYLYSPNYNDDGITNGMWGLMRAYDPSKSAAKLTKLPNNTNPTPVAAGTDLTCPAGAQPVKFNITATTAQRALSGVNPSPEDGAKGQLVYNSRGPGRGSSNPNNVLRNRLAIMYFHTEDLDPSTGRLRPNVPVEPLILRAAAGDCIEVTLTNAMPGNSDLFLQPLKMPAPFTDDLNLRPTSALASKRVGLHPQLLSYDVTTSNGLNVGYNNDQSAGGGESPKTYRWYAGNVERGAGGALSFTPVELGSLGLFPSDPLFQHPNAMYGGMIIEPRGSTWTCDGGAPCNPTPGLPTVAPPISRASATVTMADGTKFREFVTMFGDDLRISRSNTSAVNYRTEPTQNYRFGGSGSFSPDGDNRCALSNLLVLGDPQTPIFSAAAGTPVRFRMIHPPGVGNEVFTISGHVWQRNPYTDASTVIGNNLLSQWMGSRDNHASTDHADIVIDRAGGAFGVSGDYLYTAFLPSQTRRGLWGLFRVTPNTDAVTISGVVASPPTVVRGANTVNPTTGRFAASVNLFSGSAATGTPVCTAPVDPFKGTWCFNCSGSPPCSVPSSPLLFTVASADGGVVTFNPAAQAACTPRTGTPRFADPPDDTQRFKPQPANTTDRP